MKQWSMFVGQDTLFPQIQFDANGLCLGEMCGNKPTPFCCCTVEAEGPFSDSSVICVTWFRWLGSERLT